MASKSALPTPTIIIDNGKEEASTIAYGKNNDHLMKRNLFFFENNCNPRGKSIFLSFPALFLCEKVKSDKKV